ncbi:FAD dependent oxidoreductase-domain-containing protein [Pavlovales sp. CCMP2436]|nr:FAD dependent oxidoreductase-domain-containing protein [Pavlovales sp. CCMP2436]
MARVGRALLSTAQRAARELRLPPVPFASSCSVLEAALPNDLGTLFVGITSEASIAMPGNGGMRVWSYASLEDAREEARQLAHGMARKHSVHGTGFAGAKLVCAINGDASSLSKRQKGTLMDSVAKTLDLLGGNVYTGCDLNTTVGDMESLSSISPYVLAALGNLAICPNTTTAHGVVGAVEAAFDHNLRGRRFIVHGCGAVGSVVAAELRDAGAVVMTLDIDPARAAIDGVEPLSLEDAWWTVPCDAIVPCSSSYLVDDVIAKNMAASALVGATNLLFRTPSAHEIVLARNIVFVPESVSSAGAVIGDSVEHFDREAFVGATPASMYAFVRSTVSSKTYELLATAAALGVAPSSAEARAVVAATASKMGPVGMRFHAHREVGLAPAAPSPASLFSLSLKAARALQAAPVNAAAAGQWRTAAAALPGRAQYSRTLSTAAGGLRGSAAYTPAVAHDVVIAGAGIMGLNIAYQLKRRAPELSVLVLESAPGLGHGSSGYSTGFQRAYYSFDETMQLALDGMSAYKNWRAYTGLADAQETFVETGALWMLGKPQAENEAMQARLAKYGIGATVLDAAGVKDKYPLMSTDPFPCFDDEGNEQPQSLGELSAVFEHGCGHVDPNACLADMLSVVRREGVEVRFNTPVEDLLLSPDGSKCTGVRTGTESISAGVVVNASGPWFNKLMGLAGVKMSTVALPTRIQVAHKYVPDEYLDLPFTADGWGPSGIYFMPRRQNKQLVFGSIAHRFESEIVDPDQCNPALDPDVKQDFLNCLLHRLPGLESSGEVSGFSSMYTVNQQDVHPMIGETQVQGLWACNGFSGHGFKLAPAVGALVAQQVTGVVTSAWETSCPLDFMSPHREPLTLKVKTHFA